MWTVQLAAARFDNVVVDEPEPMQSADIGATAQGSTTTEGLETTIAGNGGDIWGSADAFRFSYTRWNGNGTIMARVRSLEDTNAWAKAGIMFRESLAPGSKHVMAIVSSSRGLAVQSRSSTGGVSASTTPVPGRRQSGWLSAASRIVSRLAGRRTASSGTPSERLRSA